MNEREKKIIEAAVEVFHRYGVKRASMSDIADEAGVSRQTVYNAFSNKDEILRGSIRLYTEQAIPKVEARVAATEDLTSQVMAVLEAMTIRPYQDLHRSPNAQDLVDGYNAAGRAELEKAYERYRAVLTDILSPYSDGLALRSLTPETVAEVVQRAAAAFKYGARDYSHLIALLEALATMTTSCAERR